MGSALNKIRDGPRRQCQHCSREPNVRSEVDNRPAIGYKIAAQSFKKVVFSRIFLQTRRILIFSPPEQDCFMALQLNSNLAGICEKKSTRVSYAALEGTICFAPGYARPTSPAIFAILNPLGSSMVRTSSSLGERSRNLGLGFLDQTLTTLPEGSANAPS